MAKIFSIVFKSRVVAQRYTDRIEKTYSWLYAEYKSIENIKTLDNGEVFHFIIGHNNDLNVEICKGLLGFTNSTEWSLRNNYSDGNYFIYKIFQDGIELNSDFTGSRSIWYYYTDEYFIFSSIQIPVIIFKGSFKLNKNTFGWMINSGSIGPENSWDSEIEILPQSTILKFNFSVCEAQMQNVSNYIFNENYLIKDKQKLINGSIEDHINSLKFESNRTMHLLSGGVESRFLFHSTVVKKNLPCLTWTTSEGKHSGNSDYAIAKRLTEVYNLAHFEFVVDEHEYSPEVIFDNFLKFGEGRIDHIYSYLDNFELWRGLAFQNITNVIRGDHNFGRYRAYSEKQCRKSLGCQMYDDIKLDLFSFIMKSHNRPLFLDKKAGESLNEYSSRLGLSFRLPYVNSSLTDLKLSFVEINNPLLDNSLVQMSQKFDPKILLNKNLLRSMNDAIIKGIPYASFHYTENNNYVIEKYFKNFILEKFDFYLDSAYLSVFEFEESEIFNLKERLKRAKVSDTSNLKALIPRSVKKYLNQFKSEKVADIRIAFRLVMIMEMVKKISALTNSN